MLKKIDRDTPDTPEIGKKRFEILSSCGAHIVFRRRTTSSPFNTYILLSDKIIMFYNII